MHNIYASITSLTTCPTPEAIAMKISPAPGYQTRYPEFKGALSCGVSGVRGRSLVARTFMHISKTTKEHGCNESSRQSTLYSDTPAK